MAKNVENEVAKVEDVEKVPFKEKIKVRADEFVKQHPKLIKAAKTTGKVVGTGLVFAGGVLLGNAISNSGGDDSDGIFIDEGGFAEVFSGDGPTED